MPDIPQAERRTRPEIRAAFEQMFELLVPFFDPDNTWNRQPQLGSVDIGFTDRVSPLWGLIQGAKRAAW